MVDAGPEPMYEENIRVPPWDLELQREITLIELTPRPYFFVSNICLV